VPIRPASGVTVKLLDNGSLELYSPQTAKRFQCNRVGTAMWIALRQHDGQPGAAAEMLAELWQTDPANTRADLDVWVDELTDAGLLLAEAPQLQARQETQ